MDAGSSQEYRNAPCITELRGFVDSVIELEGDTEELQSVIGAQTNGAQITDYGSARKWTYEVIRARK